ncbi:MAG: ABC transporter ATP-binding protein, partial [Thiogranum sp.]|nr:ABC transporter ATP-binding protein [Thiogranum sp.]
MSSPGTEFRLFVRQRAPIPLDAGLDCHGGELLALVGPSGSGKSTLLRIIAGLARPAEGRISCGTSIWCDSARGVHLSPQQRRVGFVPQHYGLFPHMTALANVMAGLAHLSSPQREHQARGWLAKVHLDGLEQRRPAEMSGGQQQRVALARALARDPAILLLDEPFSAVDRATRETLYLELAELKRQLAIPAILVTHDLTEALLLADRLTLLSRGRTVQSGAPREVLAHPVNETAARLVGVRNLFDGEILRHDAETKLTWFRAGATTLACALAPQWPAGARVRWMAPAG